MDWNKSSYFTIHFEVQKKTGMDCSDSHASNTPGMIYDAIYDFLEKLNYCRKGKKTKKKHFFLPTAAFFRCNFSRQIPSACSRSFKTTQTSNYWLTMSRETMLNLNRGKKRAVIVVNRGGMGWDGSSKTAHKMVKICNRSTYVGLAVRRRGEKYYTTSS